MHFPQLVVWLPALCRKMQVPYAIVKVCFSACAVSYFQQSKARLGALVHKKTATAVALTDVKKEDQAALNKLIETVNTNYTERFEEVCLRLVGILLILQIKRHFGGGIMGEKTNARLARLAKIKAREVAAKMG